MFLSLNLYAVGYGGGLFVATGKNGIITTSPDGITWISRTSGTTIDLRAVAYGNDLFVAVGSSGTTIKIVVGASTEKVGAGFTQKILDGDSTKYRLFDGRTIKLNSNGSVTWE
jgi:hypothetical protein